MGHILLAPDIFKPFVLGTVASETGSGAGLSQVANGVQHQVTYIRSKQLKPLEELGCGRQKISDH